MKFIQQEVKRFQTIDELEAFLLKHGENIVDLMGGEIDRIEMKLRVGCACTFASRVSQVFLFRKSSRRFAIVTWKSCKYRCNQLRLVNAFLS